MNESSPPPLPQTLLPKTSGLAIASMALGIVGILSCGLSLLLFAPVVGLILGIVALNKIRQSNGQLQGKGMAVAGIITNGITFLMIPILAAMLLPALAAAKQRAQEISSMNNEKQLAMAVLIYSNDHTNHFPVATEWCDQIQNKVGNSQVFKSFAAKNSSSRCDYAYNAQLDGLDADSIKYPARTVLIYESDAGWNASGGPELFPARSRYGSGSKQVYVVAFVDGHVEAITRSRMNSLIWDPNQ